MFNLLAKFYQNLKKLFPKPQQSDFEDISMKIVAESDFYSESDLPQPERGTGEERWGG